MRAIFMILVVSLVSACAHYPVSVEGLHALGYEPQGSRYTNDVVKQVEPYHIWAKETTDDGRRLHLCLVPGWNSAGYNWQAIVYVESIKAWEYDGTTSGKPSVLNTGISCISTEPLPAGRLSWQTGYQYWQ